MQPRYYFGNASINLQTGRSHVRFPDSPWWTDDPRWTTNPFPTSEYEDEHIEAEPEDAIPEPIYMDQETRSNPIFDVTAYDNFAFDATDRFDLSQSPITLPEITKKEEPLVTEPDKPKKRVRWGDLVAKQQAYEDWLNEPWDPLPKRHRVKDTVAVQTVEEMPKESQVRASGTTSANEFNADLDDESIGISSLPMYQSVADSVLEASPIPPPKEPAVEVTPDPYADVPPLDSDAFFGQWKLELEMEDRLQGISFNLPLPPNPEDHALVRLSGVLYPHIVKYKLDDICSYPMNAFRSYMRGQFMLTGSTMARDAWLLSESTTNMLNRMSSNPLLNRRFTDAQKMHMATLSSAISSCRGVLQRHQMGPYQLFQDHQAQFVKACADYYFGWGPHGDNINKANAVAVIELMKKQKSAQKIKNFISHRGTKFAQMNYMSVWSSMRKSKRLCERWILAWATVAYPLYHYHSEKDRMKIPCMLELMKNFVEYICKTMDLGWKRWPLTPCGWYTDYTVTMRGIPESNLNLATFMKLYEFISTNFQGFNKDQYEKLFGIKLDFAEFAKRRINRPPISNRVGNTFVDNYDADAYGTAFLSYLNEL